MKSLVENDQAGHVILHFAESAENGVAIPSDGGIVAGFRKLRLSAARAAGEDGFGRVCPDRPHRTLHVQKLGDVCGLPSAIRKQIQRRKVGGAGNADLRVRSSHLAFGFGDIWTALQKIGRQPWIQRGRFGVQFLGSKMIIRSGFAEQNGNRVLELLSLLLKQDGLRPRSVEKGLFLRDIEAGSYAAFVARVHQLQALLQRLDGTIQNAQLGVELANGEVIPCKLRSDDQAHIFQIRGARLIASLRSLDAAAAPAKEVDFIAGSERQNEIVLRYCGGNGKRASGWAVP